MSIEDEIDLYKQFGILKSATTQQIKTRYKKLCLEYHPDKNVDATPEELVSLTAKFQSIADHYQVLIDPTRRQRYDSTGSFDVSATDDFVDYKSFFDALFKKVELTDIEEYEKLYKYSELERGDLFSSYIKRKGSLLDTIDDVPYSSYDDLARYQDVIQSGIDAGEIPALKKFPAVNQRELKKRISKAAKEVKEAEAIATEATNNAQSEADLSSAIQLKNQERLAKIIGRIEVKAIGENRGGKKHGMEQEPSEEEFLAMKSKLFGVKDGESGDIIDDHIIKERFKKTKK